jgi:hypothetical protein
VVAALGASSCSFLYDLSPDQCGATAECVSRFGDGFVCDDGLCKDAPSRPPASDAGSTPAEGHCEAHADCLERHGDIEPHVCVDNACVKLKSEECPLVLPLKNEGWLENLKTSDALVFGAYSPIPESSLLSNYTRFVDLAVNEVSEEVRGLPGPKGSRRQVVVVVCEGETPTPEQLLASATHLIDVLRVPGIVSTLQSSDLQYVVEERGLTGDTFFMSALDADDVILNMQDEGLVWTMLTGPDQVAVTFAPLVERSIEYLRGSGGVLEDDEQVRVALVSPTGEPRLLGDLDEAILESIEFNGASAAENSPEHFRAIDIDTVYGDPEAATDQSAVVDALLEFKPHLVLAMAANEFLSQVIPSLESN